MLKPHTKLVFEETFTQSRLDETVWTYDVGEKWFNDERQCYLKDHHHVQTGKDGLTIVADLNPASQACRYQSGRIHTKGKQSFQYGTFLFRAKLPKGKGSWPAIWLLPEDIGKVKWPLCGEIDVMEMIGRDPEVVHFSLHSQLHNHMIKTQRTKFNKIPTVQDTLHDYKMIWRKEGLSFFVDDVHQVTFDRPSDDRIESWPFDKPYHLILNIAVGGTWGGEIDESSLPYKMDITSIKVFQE
jgi:beta-glucanase (GH16 family)